LGWFLKTEYDLDVVKFMFWFLRESIQFPTLHEMKLKTRNFGESQSVDYDSDLILHFLIGLGFEPRILGLEVNIGDQ
jgi:hypothetical protein